MVYRVLILRFHRSNSPSVHRGGVTSEARSFLVLHYSISALRLETAFAGRTFRSTPEGAEVKGKATPSLRRLWRTKVLVVATNAHLALALYKQRERGIGRRYAFTVVFFFAIVVLIVQLFHVKHYRPRSTKSTLMSLGETPGMRLACAKVSGSILVSFWRASVESDCREL